MKHSTLIINGYFLAHPYSGQGVYTAQLLSQFLEVYTGRITILCLDTTSRLAGEKYRDQHPNVTIKTFSLQWLPLKLRLLLAEIVWIPFQLYRSKKYTYFSPYAHPLLFAPKHSKHFMTLHDTIFFKEKDYKHKWSRKVYNALLLQTVRQKNIQLLTVSHVSALEIQNTLAPYHTPLVAYNGVDHLHTQALISSKALQERFGIGTQYIFYHGGYDKRKNVQYVIDIYLALKKLLPKLQLVLGGQALYENTLYQKVENFSGIIQTGFINNSELRSLYHHASLFISSSTNEGFNIPIGEALMEDTPVLASDIAAHRELWKGYVDLIPLDDLHTAVTIAKKAIEHGKKPFQSHIFSWKNCSKKILEYFG